MSGYFIKHKPRILRRNQAIRFVYIACTNPFCEMVHSFSCCYCCWFFFFIPSLILFIPPSFYLHLARNSNNSNNMLVKFVQRFYEHFFGHFSQKCDWFDDVSASLCVCAFYYITSRYFLLLNKKKDLFPNFISISNYLQFYINIIPN